MISYSKEIESQSTHLLTGRTYYHCQIAMKLLDLSRRRILEVLQVICDLGLLAGVILIFNFTKTFSVPHTSSNWSTYRDSLLIHCRVYRGVAIQFGREACSIMELGNAKAKTILKHITCMVLFGK
jgi:hypothetical protein